MSKLLMPYFALNSIMEPFTSLFWKCEYVVLIILKFWHRIHMFVNLGYSQVLVYKSSHSKMALFGVKKLTRKKVLIGSHNAALVFVPIMVVVLKD